MAKPTVVRTDPADQDTGVSRSSPIYVRVDNSLAPSTVTNSSCFLSIKSTMDIIAATVSYTTGTKVINIVPTRELESNTTYVVIISNTVTDVGGSNYMDLYQFEFTTAGTTSSTSSSSDSALDVVSGSYSTTDLHISRVYPAINATNLEVMGCEASGASPLQFIDIQFNNELDTTSIASGPNFLVDQDTRGPAIKVVGRAVQKVPGLADHGRVQGLIELVDSRTLRFRFVDGNPNG